jgi:hypothetical protein
MEKLQFECRKCKKKTTQLVRIITDNLPANVKTIQCTVCSCMTVAMIGDVDASL